MSCFTCEKDLWQEAASLLVINAAVCAGFCAFIFNYGPGVCVGSWGWHGETGSPGREQLMPRTKAAVKQVAADPCGHLYR